ncbi:hypothetical protein SVAN01_04210 [Stagonosporopsis vannaccii]|nr:hypothetical protein SVAN01_04210 [Stagonosporopsis vannaccii]
MGHQASFPTIATALYSSRFTQALNPPSLPRGRTRGAIPSSGC